MEDPRVISIHSATFVRAIAIGALAYALWMLRDLVLLVLAAIVIASAIEPGVLFFVRYRIPRVVAVLGMYLAVFGSLFGVVYFFLPPILADIQGILSLVPDYLGALHLPGPFNDPSQLFTAIENTGGGDPIINSILTFQSAFTGSSEAAFKLVAAAFGGIISFILVAVLSFYLAVRDTGVEDFLRLITPAAREEYVVGLWLRARDKIGLWMQGQVLSSVIGGVLSYLGLLLLGVPYALLLAVFTAVMMLVPIFGSFLSAIPALTLAFSAGGTGLMFAVLALYVIINQFESHLIHPLVVNKVVGVPPLLVILALIIGFELAGFLGVLIAIPVAAACREFLNDYDRGKREAVEIA
ncbi:MAG TPA: AI-2E family transporter [Candidatus Paceibacterota bacterium]|jgi:predicted PurR-regulated permease PerM